VADQLDRKTGDMLFTNTADQQPLLNVNKIQKSSIDAERKAWYVARYERLSYHMIASPMASPDYMVANDELYELTQEFYSLVGTSSPTTAQEEQTDARGTGPVTVGMLERLLKWLQLV
jgi:hypothetical protein